MFILFYTTYSIYIVFIGKQLFSFFALYLAKILDFLNYRTAFLNLIYTTLGCMDVYCIGVKMEQIVLSVNLKYVITALNVEQRGRLLNALLCVDDGGLKDEMVCDIYTYIKTLQEEIKGKKQRMKQLALMAVEKRKQNNQRELCFEKIEDGDDKICEDKALELFNEPSVDQDDSLRKEPKEYNNININKNNLSILDNKKSRSQKNNNSKFIPPKVEVVKKFIEEFKLEVDAEEFVDFYESRGWCVGNSKIKNWQAMAKLWHRRAKNNEFTNGAKLKDDEEYWSQMQQKVETQSVLKNPQ